MQITYKLNGQTISEETAMNAYVNYDIWNCGCDTREAVAIFDRARERDMDGAIAREYLLDAGVEMFFSGTSSSYDGDAA